MISVSGCTPRNFVMMMTAPPSDNVWIGDLPAVLTKQELDQVFGAYGDITQSKMIPPKVLGQKASAMIRFATVEEATWLVENLNGNLVEGLPEEPVKVRFANQGGHVEAGAPGKAQQGQPFGKEQQGGKGQHIWVKTKLCNNFLAGDCPRGAGCWFAHGEQEIGTQTVDKGKGGPCGKGGPYDGQQAASGCGIVISPKGCGKAKGPVAIQNLLGTAVALFKQSLGEAARIPPEQQVYIGNLPPDTQDEHLYQLFSPFGAIAPNGIRAMKNPDGNCKGIGFVDFLSAESASNAVAVLDKLVTPDGGQIVVNTKVQKAAHDAAAQGASPGVIQLEWGGV